MLHYQHTQSSYTLFIFIVFIHLGITEHTFAAPSPLTAKNLGVIVNESDPLSVKVANYYIAKRHIPPENIIYIRFATGYKTLPVKKFQLIKNQIDLSSGEHIQAYVITWTLPYRVDCMSMTTAIAAGYHKDYCAKGCLPTRASPYFNSPSSTPFDSHRIRPAMVLAGENFEQIKSLIDRGVKSDHTHPQGTAFFLKTSDKNRSVRAQLFPVISNVFSDKFPSKFLDQDFIQNQTDVMFYFTGKKHVEHIASNTFLPGAVADHLTSAGGNLAGGKQMNVLEWLKAGVTGSYGTVVEPCNFLQKFPHPGILMHHYLNGDTLIEAYWKSVAWPGQGIFVGEPLAKPFANQ